MQKLATLVIVSAFLALSACDNGGGATTGDEGGKPESIGKEGKTDQWNAANAPNRFQVALEYKYDTLKGFASGRAAQIPWPSDYWATYQDSINVRYKSDGALSPAEKYDQAFNGWTPDGALNPVDISAACKDGVVKLEDAQKQYYAKLGKAAKWQHENKGHGDAMNGVDDDNDGTTDECTGSEYDGIETWWGLCHAWTPAAILEPEPLKPVTVNGVTFSVSDIKALLISVYEGTSSYMLGGRCNEKEVKRDEQGRMTQDECRDTNAGAFYVVITNLLGKDKRAFAEDRTAGYQVWNQPVLGYTIQKEEVIDEGKAVELLKQPGKPYATTFNSPNAVAWRYVKMDVDYISESSNTDDEALTPNIGWYTRTDHYELIVELDKDGKVVGGEWINYSQDTHPDFLWLPVRSGNGGNPYISLAKVRELVTLSRKEEEPATDVNVREFGGAENVPIPDNDPNGIARTLAVTDDLAISSLKVKVEVLHTYVGDLRIVLAKDGVQVVLHDKVGGGTDNLNETYTVHEFDGASTKGEWTLTVVDTAAQDSGTLKGWTLVVGSGAPTSVPTTRAYTATTPATDIPDATAAGFTSTITVTDEGVVRTLKLTVDITHPYIGDLNVALKHGGQSKVVHAREGGSADDLKKTFDVPDFAGAALKGAWELNVSDNDKQDKGKLNGWSFEATID